MNKKTINQMKKLRNKLTPALLTLLLIVQMFLPVQVFFNSPYIEIQEANAYGNGWLDGWDYRTPIEIDGNTEDLTNYQVQITLQGTNSSADNYVDFDKVLTGGADIRFTDNDKTTPIDFWIEEWVDTSESENATVWVEIPSLPTAGIKMIYVYYGKAGASSGSDGDDTFEFFDGFESSIPTITTENFFTDNGKDSVFYRMNHPRGQYYNNKTYIAYQGPDLNPYVMYYDHNLAKWSDAIKVGTNPLAGDSHGNPALLVDNVGYIHIFYGCHSGAMQYTKSTNPEDITSWNAMSSPTANATYPQIMQMSDGTIYIFYREGGHTADWVYRTSTDGGNSWSTAISVINSTSANVWYTFFKKGINDTIHIGFCWEDELYGNDNGDLAWQRFDIYYMFRDTDGNWKNMAGTTLTTPLSFSDAENYAKVYESGADHAENPSIDIDNNNNPYLVFTTGSGTSYIHKFARWNGSAWVLTNITTTDHIFDDPAIIVHSNSDIDVFLCRNGTTGSGSGDGDWTDRGGNVEKWTTTNGGDDWVKAEDIITKAETGDVYAAVSILDNYNFDAYLAFYNFSVSGGNERKVYLWGNSGFIQRDIQYDLNPDKWHCSKNISINNSEIFLDNNDIMYTKSSWGAGYAVKSRAKADEQDIEFVAFRSSYDITPSNILAISNTDYVYSDEFNKLYARALTDGQSGQVYVDNQLDFRNTYRTYEITRTSGNAKYYQDGNLIHNGISFIPTVNLGVGVNVWDSTQESTLILDWILVRKYVSTEPTSTTTSVFRGYDKIFTEITNTISATDYISYSVEPTVGNLVDMTIIPASGSISASIDTWNTSGTYYKKWTETGDENTGNTTHTIGDLKTNTYYTVKVDTNRFNTYLSDGSGEISFIYTGGYSSHEFEIEEDTTPPAVFNLSSPSDNSYTNDNTPTLSWNASSDSESGLAKYQLYIDGSLDTDNIDSSATSTTPTSALLDGSYDWYIKAIDNANNSRQSTSTYTINIDTVSSFATFDSGLPDNPTATNSTDITIAGTDITHYKYKLDSGSYGDEIAVATHLTLSDLADGEHTLYLIGRDIAGNYQTTATEHTWTTDITAPVISLSSPVNDSSTGEKKPTLTWSGSDATSGIAKYQLYIDGSLDTDNLTGTSTTPINNLSCGSHSWYIKAIDNAGNSTNSSVFNLTINCGPGLPSSAYSPPAQPTPTPENPNNSFSIIINNNNEYTNNQTVTLNLNAGSDTKRMAISNTEDFKYASQIDYQEEIEWDILRGRDEALPRLYDGDTYIVYAKFYTQYGVPSEIVSDSIIYNPESENISSTDPGTEPGISPDPDPSEPGTNPNNPETPSTEPIPTFTQTLQPGSNNNQVINLQNKLKELNFFPKNIKSNGNFGPTTKQAVIDYQKSKGIYPCGMVGPRTRKALNNEEFITNQDYQFTQDLKYNDKNEEVKQLQTRLRDQNFFPYHINSTGWFGPITQKAVKLFQGFYDLIENGMAGEETRGMLNR